MNRGLVLILRVALATLALSASSPNTSGASQTPTEHSVGSRPETVSWGWFPLDKPPVLTIALGVGKVPSNSIVALRPTSSLWS